MADTDDGGGDVHYKRFLSNDVLKLGIIRPLGSGAYGVVHEVRLLESALEHLPPGTYALKEVNFDKVSDREKRVLERELELPLKIRHRLFCQCFYSWVCARRSLTFAAAHAPIARRIRRVPLDGVCAGMHARRGFEARANVGRTRSLDCQAAAYAYRIALAQVLLIPHQLSPSMSSISSTRSCTATSSPRTS